jgi:hypothetical protein
MIYCSKIPRATKEQGSFLTNVTSAIETVGNIQQILHSREALAQACYIQLLLETKAAAH